jgi:hypothetical protein
MGGISIDLALQVGFMLCALLSRYQAMIQEFLIGCHSLTEATLQTVVEQCVNFDKDPWLCPGGKDSKAPHSTSANAAGTTTAGEGDDAYDPLAGKSFDYHFGRWKKAIRENKGKCMFCHNTVHNTNHKTKDCPILKKLGMKLEKHTDVNNCLVASCVASAMPAPAPAPASIAPLAPDTTVGSSSVPGGFLVAAEGDAFDSGNDYEYEGNWSGAMYSRTTNRNTASYFYIGPDPYGRHTSAKEIPVDTAHSSDIHLSSRTSHDPQGLNAIYLPKSVLNLF